MTVVIVCAKRTAIGNFGGALQKLSAIDFSSQLAKDVLSVLPENEKKVDEVIIGQVFQSGCGQNPARQVALNAGLAQETPAYTVNKVCGSGMKTLTLACQAIESGEADAILAGGMESMSNAPYLLDKSRWGSRLGHFEGKDAILTDGLWCSFNDYHMGLTAENLVDKYDFSREEQDQFATDSQSKCGEAQNAGLFESEISPISIKDRKGETFFDKDEYPRPETTVESLAGLRPAFKKDGSVTAGNSSGINDGAAMLLLMSKEKAESLALEVLAEVVNYASVGLDPALMGLGPVYATQKVLQKSELSLDDIDIFELNEAFASQSMAVIEELGIDPQKVNVNGGSIALGHPIGASGARITVTLIHEMIRRNSKYGLASLCIGGGQGIAMILKR